MTIDADNLWVEPLSKAWWLPPKRVPGFITLRGLVVPSLRDAPFPWLRVRLSLYKNNSTGLGLLDESRRPVCIGSRLVVVRLQKTPRPFGTAWRMKHQAYKAAFRDGTLDVTIDGRRLQWWVRMYTYIVFLLLGVPAVLLLFRGDFPSFAVAEAGVLGGYFALSTLGWVTGSRRSSTLCTRVHMTSTFIEWTTTRGQTHKKLWSETTREEIEPLGVYDGVDGLVALQACVEAAFGRPTKQHTRRAPWKVVLRFLAMVVWPTVWVIGPVLLASWLFNPWMMAVFKEMGGRMLIGMFFTVLVTPVYLGAMFHLASWVKSREQRRKESKHHERRTRQRLGV